MVYNVPQFRKELKDAFDMALRGEEVFVERSGVLFRLSTSNVTPITQKEFMPPIAGKIAASMDREYNFCKHDQIKGLCKKGCK